MNPNQLDRQRALAKMAVAAAVIEFPPSEAPWASTTPAPSLQPQNDAGRKRPWSLDVLNNIKKLRAYNGVPERQQSQRNVTYIVQDSELCEVLWGGMQLSD